METAYFRNIRKELINALNQSQNEIRIAIAWFTNQELFDSLISCLERDIEISLIIIDDYINNRDAGLNFQNFIDKGGKLMYGKAENLMHHKFCIIDNSVLFTGSYNWTYCSENKNLENVIKVENGDLIKQYITEFEALKEQLDVVIEANTILFDDSERVNFFSIKNYIDLDLVSKKQEKSKTEPAKKEVILISDNSIIGQNEILRINSVQKIQNTNQKSFNNNTIQPDYYYLLNTSKNSNETRNGKKIKTGASYPKIIFANNNLHRTIFAKMDDLCKGLSIGNTIVTELFVYGYTVNYTPPGKKIIRTVSDGKGNKYDKEFDSVPITVLGTRAYTTDNGDFIEATGESPKSIYRNMLKNGMFREVDSI